MKLRNTHLFSRLISMLLVIGFLAPDLHCFDLHAAAGSGYDEAEEEELASEPAVPDYSAYTYTGTHVSSNNWWLLENYDGLKRNTIHKKVQADIRSKNQNLAPDELTIYYR